MQQRSVTSPFTSSLLDSFSISLTLAAAVIDCSSRTWFEFFWIPLIPFTKHRIWKCGICRESGGYSDRSRRVGAV